MIYLFVTILLFYCFIGKKIEGTWCNLLSLFNIIWAAISILASFKLYGMYDFSSKPYKLVAIGCTFFTAGYIFYNQRPFRLVLTRRENACEHCYHMLRSQVFNAVFLLTVIFWAVLGVTTIRLLLSGVDYKIIRDIYGGTNETYSMFSSSYMMTICNLIFVPLVYVITAIVIESIFSERLKVRHYLGAIILLIEYCLTTGSRVILLYTIMQLIFLMYSSKQLDIDKYVSKKLRRRIRIILLIMVGAIMLITVMRPSRTAITWTNTMTYYAYISLPIPLSDYWLNVVDSTGFRSYGVAFFRGILSLISRFITLPSGYYNISEYLSVCADSYIPMFANGAKTFNAFLSVFFYFYVDFGYVGVAVGCLLFGVFSSTATKGMLQNDDRYKTVLFLIFLISIITSFARWQFVNANYVMMFILARLLYTRQFDSSDIKE